MRRKVAHGRPATGESEAPRNRHRLELVETSGFSKNYFKLDNIFLAVVLFKGCSHIIVCHIQRYGEKEMNMAHK